MQRQSQSKSQGEELNCHNSYNILKSGNIDDQDINPEEFIKVVPRKKVVINKSKKSGKNNNIEVHKQESSSKNPNDIPSEKLKTEEINNKTIIDKPNDSTEIPKCLSVSPKPTELKSSKNIIILVDETADEPKKPVINNGSQHRLNSRWVLWIHPNESKNWRPESYEKIMDVMNIADFWSLINNFDKLEYKKNQFFLMRYGILPIWEDKRNRSGGTCSYRFNVSDKNCLDFWFDTCMLGVNEILYTPMSDITGFSFSTKNSFAMVKIWNTDGSKDVSKYISDIIVQKYPHATPKYEKNKPEY